MDHEELMMYPKEHIVNQAKLFQRGLLMWKDLYRKEVGEERYQQVIKNIKAPTIMKIKSLENIIKKNMEDCGLPKINLPTPRR